MRRSRQLTPLEEWSSTRRRGDIPDLLRNITVKCDRNRGYFSIIDDFRIAEGQSPSELRRKTKKALERMIRTPGVSAWRESEVTTRQFRGAVAMATKAVAAILRN